MHSATIILTASLIYAHYRSGLDWAQPEGEDLPPTTPVIVVLHGLTGGSYEPYVRSVLSVACRSVSEGGLGYRAVVMNFRGCRYSGSLIFRSIPDSAYILHLQAPALS